MDMPQRPADENQYFTGGCSHHFMSRVPRLRPLVDLHFLPGGIDVEDSFKLSGMVAYSYYWIFTSHRLVANQTKSDVK
jgi:hypothetical protein